MSKIKVKVLKAHDEIVRHRVARACVELWDLTNGLTLCRRCHYKLDNRKYYE